MSASSSSAYRIGIDARLYRSQTGGIGRYSRELIAHLAAIDHVNEYYIFLTEADAVEWHCENPNFYPVIAPIGHYTPQEQTAFLKILNSYHLDLVHFLNYNHPVLYRRPFIVTLHDLTLFHKSDATSKSAKNPLRRLAFEVVFRRAVHGAKRVIAVSEHTAHDAERTLKVSHAKMEVIAEGVTPPFEIPFGSKKQVQDYLGTKDPYILFVSQWRSHKGIITLLDAFAELKRNYQLPHKLVLLGRQESAPESIKEALVASPVSSEVLTPGFAPDELLPALYAYTSAFAMPSEYEGFGLPVLEALSYGAPTVSADNSSLPEVGGNAVLYFKTGDSHELAQRLFELLTDEELVQKLRANGLKQVKKFNWHTAAQKTWDVYQAVLEKHR